MSEKNIAYIYLSHDFKKYATFDFIYSTGRELIERELLKIPDYVYLYNVYFDILQYRVIDDIEPSDKNKWVIINDSEITEKIKLIISLLE